MGAHARPVTTPPSYAEASLLSRTRRVSDRRRLAVRPCARRAAAFAGMKRYEEALEHLGLAERRVAEMQRHERRTERVLDSRCGFSFKRDDRPKHVQSSHQTLHAALPGMKGEALGSRALALADDRETRGGAVDGRERCVGDLRNRGAGAVPDALPPCPAIKARQLGMSDLAEEMIDHAYKVGAVDPVVTAYRANTRSAFPLLATPATTERAVFIVGRAEDAALAEHLGTILAGRLDPTSLLSRREREVYELVCARVCRMPRSRSMLYISESTVKVHVHHVFDKLGIRSRHRAGARRRCSGCASSLSRQRVRDNRVGRPEVDRSKLSLRGPSDRRRSRSASTDKNAITASVENWLPIAWSSRSRATRYSIARRYGRFEVIAL